jgi:hypothetical protein
VEENIAHREKLYGIVSLPFGELNRLKVQRHTHDLDVCIATLFLERRDQVDFVILLKGINDDLRHT